MATALKQAERDRQIIRWYRQGRSIEWIEAQPEIDIKRRRVYQVIEDGRKDAPTKLEEEDALALVNSFLERFQGSLDDLGELWDGTKHENVKLGIIARRAEVLRDMWQVFQGLGMIPDDLGDLGQIAEGRRVAEIFKAVLEEFDAPAELRDALLMALRGETPQRLLT